MVAVGGVRMHGCTSSGGGSETRIGMLLRSFVSTSIGTGFSGSELSLETADFVSRMLYFRWLVQLV